MSTRLSSILASCCIVLLLWLLFACQQPTEPQVKIEAAETNAQKNTSAEDFSLMCQNIEKQMAEINDQRTTFALEQINQNLKVCLPLLDHQQQKNLMKHANQMYERFLKVERTPAQQHAFEQYALEMAQHPTIQQSHYAELTARDQYLLKHKGQAYVELIDLGENQLNYRRSPEYLARVFAPYLPEAEKVFIETLAQQNQEPVFNQERLLIEPAEIAARIMVWEDYLERYPKSIYRKDAEHLLQQYSYFLFHGLEQKPISQDYRDRYAVDSQYRETIVGLSKGNEGGISSQAQRFLEFLDMDEEQRRQTIPKELRNSPVWEQIAAYADIPVPDPNYKKNCFKDAICI
ncbi:hypothetical protein ABEF90_01465 [Acinetobacter thermotolerans]|uniref:hypothetical protein n=1 Tax=Acinetobacter TaxID=469 RepID=UPI00055474EA|nr:hypothetical protein [Acinetobacter sp. HR7]